MRDVNGPKQNTQNDDAQKNDVQDKMGFKIKT